MSENPPVQQAPLGDEEMAQMATAAAVNLLDEPTPPPPSVEVPPAPGKAKAAWENATGAATDAMAWLNAKVTTPVGEGSSLMENGEKAKRFFKIGGQVLKLAGVVAAGYALAKGHGTGGMEMLAHQSGSDAGHVDTIDTTVDHANTPAPDMDLAAHTTPLHEQHHFTEDQATIDKGEGWFKKLDEMGITDRKQQEAFLHEHGDELKDRGLAYFDEHQHQWGMNLAHPDNHGDGHLSQGDMEFIHSAGQKDGFIPHDTATVPDAAASGAPVPHPEPEGGMEHDPNLHHQTASEGTTFDSTDHADHGQSTSTPIDSTDHADHNFGSNQQIQENSAFDSTDHADHNFTLDQQAQGSTSENSAFDSTDHADHDHQVLDSDADPASAQPEATQAPTPVETPVTISPVSDIPQVSHDSGPSRALELAAAGAVLVPAVGLTYYTGKDMIESGDPLAVAAKRTAERGAAAAGKAFRNPGDTAIAGAEAAGRAYRWGKERLSGNKLDERIVDKARELGQTLESGDERAVTVELDTMSLKEATQLLNAAVAKGDKNLRSAVEESLERRQDIVERWTRELQSPESEDQALAIVDMRGVRDTISRERLDSLLDFADSMGYAKVSTEIRSVLAEPESEPAAA
jgi:hypothetical protein